MKEQKGDPGWKGFLGPPIEPTLYVWPEGHRARVIEVKG
jgi:hypothetical protein